MSFHYLGQNIEEKTSQNADDRSINKHGFPDFSGIFELLLCHPGTYHPEQILRQPAQKQTAYNGKKLIGKGKIRDAVLFYHIA